METWVNYTVIAMGKTVSSRRVNCKYKQQIKTEAEKLMKTQLCISNQIAEETVPMLKYKQDGK